MLYQYISQTEVRPSTERSIRIGNAIISNPTDADYAAIGRKPLTVDEPPAYDELTQTLTPTYEDSADAILQHWTVVPLPEVGTVEPEPVVPTLEERVAAVETYLLERILGGEV